MLTFIFVVERTYTLFNSTPLLEAEIDAKWRHPATVSRPFNRSDSSQHIGIKKISSYLMSSTREQLKQIHGDIA
jgi:hypothetical protein